MKHHKEKNSDIKMNFSEIAGNKAGKYLFELVKYVILVFWLGNKCETSCSVVLGNLSS